MMHDEPIQAVIASSTYLTYDRQCRDEAIAFRSRTDGTKAGTGLDSIQ